MPCLQHAGVITGRDHIPPIWVWCIALETILIRPVMIHRPALLDRQHHGVARATATTNAQKWQAKIQIAVIEIDIVEATQSVGTGWSARLESRRSRAVGGVGILRG